MKKILMTLLVMASVSFSHTIMVDVENVNDNKGLIKISGSTDNGESAAGEDVYLLSDVAYDGNEEVFKEYGGEDFHGKLILFKGKFDDKEELIIPKPAIKRYIVLVFAGVDHAFPAKGIPLTKDEEENWNKLIEEYSNTLGTYKEKMKTKKF